MRSRFVLADGLAAVSAHGACGGVFGGTHRDPAPVVAFAAGSAKVSRWIVHARPTYVEGARGGDGTQDAARAFRRDAPRSHARRAFGKAYEPEYLLQQLHPNLHRARRAQTAGRCRRLAVHGLHESRLRPVLANGERIGRRRGCGHPFGEGEGMAWRFGEVGYRVLFASLFEQPAQTDGESS